MLTIFYQLGGGFWPIRVKKGNFLDFVKVVFAYFFKDHLHIYYVILWSVSRVRRVSCFDFQHGLKDAETLIATYNGLSKNYVPGQ